MLDEVARPQRMSPDELLAAWNKALDVGGPAHCVEAERLAGLPGWYRVLRVHRPSTVSIEVGPAEWVWDFGEGGLLRTNAVYPGRAAMLEALLGRATSHRPDGHPVIRLNEPEWDREVWPDAAAPVRLSSAQVADLYARRWEFLDPPSGATFKIGNGPHSADTLRRD